MGRAYTRIGLVSAYEARTNHVGAGGRGLRRQTEICGDQENPHSRSEPPSHVPCAYYILLSDVTVNAVRWPCR